MERDSGRPGAQIEELTGCPGKEGDMMTQEMNRRGFFKATAVTGSLFLTGDILREGDFSQGLVKIPESEKMVITVITDNLADALRPDDRIAKRHTGTVSPLEGMLHAEHGLAYHVETVVDGRSHSFLFDYATDFQGVKKNIELLKIDFKRIEALALSHDHLDHQAALVELLKAKRTDIPPGTPFYVGEGFFVGTYMRRPDGRVVSLLALKREDLEGLGLLRIVEVKNPTPLVPGAYLTGRVERVTDYEQVPPVFVAKKGEQFVQEDFEGEQAIVLNAKGRGLVVLSGCAHRGIVNTVKHAQRITGMEEVHAVMGGFHLSGAKPEIIRKTIEDIKAIRPDYVVPTHCTGFEAISAFAREMPDQFILNTAGTRYTISA
jgi:7,8-dihydropterin-6-yl-methyl-4-(beta-D-ribofuranosyl)aminobenzene 5'-phosphate synthase